MRYLLDTDTCSYIIKRHPDVVVKFSKIKRTDVAMSVMTAAELSYGAERADGKRYKEAVQVFRHYVPTVAWPLAAVDHYGEIRANLEAQGKPIGEMDVLIAAHARALGIILVTNNTRHFSAIKGLKLENWKTA